MPTPSVPASDVLVLDRDEEPPNPDPAPSPPRRGVDPHSLRLALFPARAFLAFGWLRAGVEKVMSLEWWTGAEVAVFVDEQRDSMLPFMEPLADAVVMPAPAVTAALVLLVELALGVLLISGRRLVPSLVVANGLSVLFVLMGAVTPSAFYLVIQCTLLLGVTVDRRISRDIRIGLVAAAALASVALAPFVTTIDPAEVIHDPAIMLVTIALLVAVTQLVALVDGELRARSLRRR